MPPRAPRWKTSDGSPRSSASDLAATGVRYAETVFSPGNHARRLGGDWHGPIEAVLDGLAAGERAHGVTVRLCPDIVRDAGMDDADRTLEVALRYADRGVVALNCAGSERTGIEPFARHFRAATDAGLTQRAARRRMGGPRQHVGNPRALPAGSDRPRGPCDRGPGPRRRVGATTASPSRCARSRTSRPARIRAWARIPFPALRDAGVVVTLNSDDPAMFGGWLTEVYAAARDAWYLDDDDLAAIARAAVDASFAEEPMRRELRQAIDAWLTDPVAAPASAGGTLTVRPAGARWTSFPHQTSIHSNGSQATIREREAVVAVVGLGYVGLPLLVAIRRAGYPAIGFDTDADQDRLAPRRALLSGRHPCLGADLAGTRSPMRDDAAGAGGRGHRRAVPADAAGRRRSRPVDGRRRRDRGRRRAAPRHAGHPRVHDLAGHDGGVPPPDPRDGRTRRRRRLRARLLPRAHRPRPEPSSDPGHAEDRERADRARAATWRCRSTRRSCHSIAVTSSPREAEMAKLIENTYRQVNIALVNELASRWPDLGVDIWEALHAAATKPFGYQAFWPGPGVGGHCIAIDPTYLSWRAGQQLGYRRAGSSSTRSRSTTGMPEYVATRVARGAEPRGQGGQRLSASWGSASPSSPASTTCGGRRRSPCSSDSRPRARGSPSTTRWCPRSRSRARSCVR